MVEIRIPYFVVISDQSGQFL